MPVVTGAGWYRSPRVVRLEGARMTLTVGPPASAEQPEPPRTSSSPGRHRAPKPPRKKRDFRRARTLAGALGITLLGAALPGVGYVWTRRRLGWLVLALY